MIFSDKDLAKRIERIEALSTVDFVKARAQMFPESGATWIQAGGVYAMFDGLESPCTQTFGLGIFEEATDAGLDEVEAFFKERGAPVMHEVCPIAGTSVLNLLNSRGYEPFEMSNVLYMPLTAENNLDLKLNPQIKTRIIEVGEEDLWAKTSSRGWASEPEMEAFGDFMFEFGQISARTESGFPFLAELEGEPISSAMMFIDGDAALFAGASTIPEGRKQGGQTALLDARLRFAAERGCTIALMGAMPGSQSQRNAEKNNFRIAYTRAKWKLKDKNGE
jgi:GNAT superfamily N-acetyltransferase